MEILIIAPHQDDEVLATGGLIQKCIKLGDTVTLLFATNGDYQGSHIAQKRFYESTEALKLLGVAEDAIFYLGYGDTGMRYSHSFLRKILFENFNTPLSTSFSSMTYHPAGGKTVHAMRTGRETLLTQSAFLTDVEWFIREHNPDIIIVPFFYDMHGDHAALIRLLQKVDIFNQIPICLMYIIHGGNDTLWPPRDAKTFSCPPIISSETWKEKISIPLTDVERHKKYKALLTFTTQLAEDSDNFLVSFVKQEEIFFLLNDSEINRQKIYNHFEYRENP